MLEAGREAGEGDSVWPGNAPSRGTPDPASHRVVWKTFLLSRCYLMCIYKRPEFWALLSLTLDFRKSMEIGGMRATGYPKPQAKPWR